MEQQFV
jgi:hypothetical protein